MNKYSNINNLNKLRDARKEIQIEIKLKEIELIRNYDEFKYSFNPIRIFSVAYSKYSIVERIIDAAIKGYKFVKEHLAKRETTQNEETI